MRLKNFLYVYHLYFFKIWQDLFNNYNTVDVNQQNEYLDYLRALLHK